MKNHEKLKKNLTSRKIEKSVDLSWLGLYLRMGVRTSKYSVLSFQHESLTICLMCRVWGECHHVCV